MIAGIVILFGYVVLVWLIFFQLKWLRFSIAWAAVSALVGLHLLLIFVIGLRFVTPYSTDARVTAFREVENAFANEQLLARPLPYQVGR
ncbi:MAG: hypothetical protein JNK68_09215 [Betaproteobacteria bacterium]|nr:hypothetical protein [Betaproteobacteria bacterium]